MSAEQEIAVRHNRAANRFEAETGAGLAMVVYRMQGDTIAFTHTEVPEAMEGRGIGSGMARVALEYAREQGLKVQPLCPFIAAFINDHPEFQGLVRA